MTMKIAMSPPQSYRRLSASLSFWQVWGESQHNLPLQCLPDTLPHRQSLTSLIFCEAKEEDKIDKLLAHSVSIFLLDHPTLPHYSASVVSPAQPPSPVFPSAVDCGCSPDLWGNLGGSRAQLISTFTLYSFLPLTLKFLLSLWLFGNFLPLPLG